MHSSLTGSQQQWLLARDHLRQNRARLSDLAMQRYRGLPTVAGVDLLTRPEWLPTAPLRLSTVALAWDDAAPRATAGAAAALPVRPDGSRYGSYSAAMADLAAPSTFENRTTYRLTAADLAAKPPSLTFAEGRYFDGLDVGEACAHELAALDVGLINTTPLRDTVGDPTDPANRDINLAISTLTLRIDEEADTAEFPLHWRDPAKVGHAGDQYMVMPTGIFQAAGEPPAVADFSLWHCMIREFAEELLGEPERPSPIDYDAWPFAARMATGLDQGRITAEIVGLGVDPLTFATDLLTVVRIESGLYDELFGNTAEVNDEGESAGLWSLTPETVHELTGTRPIQAAGAAILRFAVTYRPGARGAS